MVSASCNIVFKPTLRKHPYFKPCSICPWIGWINHKHTKNENKSYTKTERTWTTYVLKTCQVPFLRLKHGISVIFCQILFLGEEERVGLLMQFWVVKCAYFLCLFQNTRQQREKRGDGKGRGNKASLMFSGSKATGQSQTDALGWQPCHSRCCSGPWLTSQVWDVIWLFKSGPFSLPVFLRPSRARQPVSSRHADNHVVQ